VVVAFGGVFVVVMVWDLVATMMVGGRNVPQLW